MTVLLSQDYTQPRDDKGSRKKPQTKELRSGVLFGQYRLRGSILVTKDSRDSVSGFISFGNDINTIPQSTAPLPVGATGLLIDYLGITGWRNGVLQTQLEAVTGDFTAGLGTVTLNVDGITLDDANTDAALIKWKSGANLTGSMGTYSTAGAAKLTIDVNTDGAFVDARFHINVFDEDGDTALFRLISDKGVGNYATFGSDGVWMGLTVGGQSTPDATLDVRGHMSLTDGITAPSTVAGKALIYVDVADGDLKVKFGDGFVRVIGADS